MKQLARIGQTLSYSKWLVPQIRSSINATTKFHKISKMNFLDQTKVKEESTVNDDSSSNKTLVTNELLCKLIGSKNYQTNSDIRLDSYSIVKCFNENDQYLGERVLREVIAEAQEINKDVVLRNDKVKPPIVKIMKYRVELMKRLIKKLTKGASEINVTQSKSEKFIAIPLRIDENDISNKISICVNLLKDFSHLQIGVYCNIYNKEEVYKATNLLQHISDELLFYGKISKPTTKKKYVAENDNYLVVEAEAGDSSKQEKSAIENIVEKETKYMSSEQKEEELIDQLDYSKKLKDAEKEAQGIITNKDMVSLEIESLLVDTSGINYDKLLESRHIEDIINGIKNNEFTSSSSRAENKSSSSIQETKQNILSGQLKVSEMSFDERLKQLQEELDSEKDLFKRLKATKKMKQFVHEMSYSKYAIQVKTIIHTEFNTMKEGMKSNPSSYL